MQKVSTFLWFNDQAELAAKFYTSLLPDSKILETAYYGENMPMPKGTVMVVRFALAGTVYQALNGGPHYQLTPAVSLSVSCETQGEVDRLWDALTHDGGQPVQCGWLTDRFGLSWQIVPEVLPRLMQGPDRARAQRVAQAMMKMVKLDIAALERA